MNDSNAYVRIEHKSGAYVAKIVDRSPPRTLVEIVAVLRHPLQGDLHHPYEPDVPLFHERRASAQREKVWVPSASLEAYDGDAPAYDDSLRQAWERHREELRKLVEAADDGARPGLRRWAEQALVQMRRLERDYWGS